jgi:hypothetical protein
MSKPAAKSPTERLESGAVGEPILVLTLSDLRYAEVLSSSSTVKTDDGYVSGRPGDILLTAYGGERYPILANVFLGAYEGLARIGDRIIARRLVHVRRAWPITTESATFNYGDDRGTVPIDRGGWLYQSDDDDFGVVNASVKHKGHAEVGSQREIDSVDWDALLSSRLTALAFLPPVLTLLALLAFAATMEKDLAWLAHTLLGIEAVLICGGAALVWWMGRERWVLKAAVASANNVAKEFQSAVRLLGHKESVEFSGMAVWRAAQTTVPLVPTEEMQSFQAPIDVQILETKNRLIAINQRFTAEMRHHLTTERVATYANIFAIIAVLACILSLIFWRSSIAVELLAIWIPSLIGAIHTFNTRRQLAQRHAATLEFCSQLRFVREQIFALASTPFTHISDPQRWKDFQATLQVLCKIVGQYGQRRLQFALSDTPKTPI